MVSRFIWLLLRMAIAREARRRWGGVSLCGRHHVYFNTANFVGAFKDITGVVLSEDEARVVISSLRYDKLPGGAHWGKWR